MSFLSLLNLKKRQPDKGPRITSPTTRLEELLKREKAVRQHQRAGELWLHAACGPKRALARSPHATQGAITDNKLVLGPAGSGRSLMLARLAKTAHAAGNQVVIVHNGTINPNNPGPLWHLTSKVEGDFRMLSTPERLSFNPFWFPAPDAWRIPSEREMTALATLLVNVLRLTRYDVPPTEIDVHRWMYQALNNYFASPALNKTSYPTFNAFAAALLAPGEGTRMNAVPAEFLDWFRKISTPFLPGGELASLLNASAEELQSLFGSSSRMVFVHVGLSREFRSEADSPAASKGEWYHEAPEAQTRALMLLLYTLDIHFGQAKARLTVVADELNYDALGTRMAAFLDRYLRAWEPYNRELVVGWHESPSTVFSDSNPGAQVILGYSGTQLLLSNSTLNNENLTTYAPLGLSQQEQQALLKLSCATRDVLVRMPGKQHMVFDAELAGADLIDFVGEERMSRLITQDNNEEEC